MTNVNHYSRSKHLKKDYYRKKLENPYYCHRTGNDPARIWRRCKIYGILSLILIVFILWALLASPWFLISKIEINGLSRTPDNLVRQIVVNQTQTRRALFWHQSNLWLFEANELTNTLNQQYNFAQVNISKRLFHTLKITITERPYAFILDDNNQYYYLDPQGYVIEAIILPINPLATTTEMTNTTTIPTGYPLVVNQNGAQINNRQIIFNDSHNDYLTAVSQIDQYLKARPEVSLNARQYVVGSEFNTLRLLTDQNLLILFNVQEDLNRQLTNLTVLKRELSTNFTNLIKKKIDLRYGAKVYYE